MWDLEAGKRTNEVEAAHCGDVVSLSLAQDQNIFVTGSVDKTCKLWDRRELKCKQVFFGHEADVNSVCVCIHVVYNTYIMLVEMTKNMILSSHKKLKKKT